MPRRDQTGPGEKGPRTGRGMGFCRGARVTNPDAAADAQKTGGGDQEGSTRSRGGGRRRRRRRGEFHAAEPTGSQGDSNAADPAQTAETDPAGTTAPTTSQEELAVLQQQADKLADELDEIRKRILESEGRRTMDELEDPSHKT